MDKREKQRVVLNIITKEEYDKLCSSTFDEFLKDLIKTFEEFGLYD